MATAVAEKGGRAMKRKIVSISSKRQITIPQQFFSMLGFESEAECYIKGNELVIRPAKLSISGGEFSEQILAELIQQGFSGNELLAAFKEKQTKVRPAVEAMLSEAEDVANGSAAFDSYEDIFGAEG